MLMQQEVHGKVEAINNDKIIMGNSRSFELNDTVIRIGNFAVSGTCYTSEDLPIGFEDLDLCVYRKIQSRVLDRLLNPTAY